MIPKPVSGMSPGEVLNLRTVQRMVDAANGYTDHARGPQAQVPYQGAQVVVWAENQTPADWELYQAVWLDGVSINPDESAMFPSPETIPLQSAVGSSYPHFGICQQPIPRYSIGRVLIAGYTVAQVYEHASLSWCPFVGFATTLDPTHLSVTPHGSCDVIWKDPAGSGVQKWAWLRLGPPRNNLMLGLTAATIVNGSYGPVDCVWGGSATGYQITAHLDWMTGGENISAGKQVMCTYFPYEDKWRITGADCE